MKRAKCFKKFIYGDAGFSFIEIAVALVIIGILSGAGLLLLGKTVESTQRKETVQRLLEAKSALLLFAENQGKLPVEKDSALAFYYQKIGSSPVDAWQNPVSYKVSVDIAQNFNVATTTPVQYDVCKRLKSPAGYAGWTPAWIKLDEQIKGVNYLANGAGGAVAALLLSGGARDADGLGSFFDGNNATGSPNYVRKYPAEDFDDLVMAITADEMYGAIKENFCTATVEVTDNRSIAPLGGVYYVYNKTIDPLKPIGSANEGNPVKVLALMGDEIEIKNATATLNFTVGSNLTIKTLATVADTRPLPLPVPPSNPTMTVKIVDLP